MFIRRNFSHILAALVTATLAACGGDGGSPYSPPSTTTPSATAPTISTQPANVSVVSGNTATFTVAASGTAPLTYQWQKNGTNVGTNSATYIDSAVVNNEVITCIMTSSSACASPTTATST